MKTIKIVGSIILTFVIVASLILNSFASTKHSSWLTLTGNVFDSGGIVPLGSYSCSFTLNTSTGNLGYTLIIDPPQMAPSSQAKSRLIYKARRLGLTYNDALILYNSGSGGMSFDAYIKNFAQSTTNYTQLASYTGSFATNTTTVSNSFSASTDKLYYFDIDLSSVFKTLYSGNKAYDIVCGTPTVYSNFYYYY